MAGNAAIGWPERDRLKHVALWGLSKDLLARV